MCWANSTQQGLYKTAFLLQTLIKSVCVVWKLCICIQIPLKRLPKGPIDNKQQPVRNMTGDEYVTSN